jgi:hypothetical protein
VEVRRWRESKERRRVKERKEVGTQRGQVEPELKAHQYVWWHHDVTGNIHVRHRDVSSNFGLGNS